MPPFYNRITRRAALQQAACGFGSLALAGLCADSVQAVNPLKAKEPHLRPRAKRIIFLFMQGGPSHVDTYDHKPLLYKNDGKQMPFDDARTIAKTGKRATSQRVMKPMWKYKQYGESGRQVSDLFCETAKHSDRPHLYSLNAHRRCGTRTGYVVPALWFNHFCATIIRLLGYLWPGVRE